MNISVIIAAAGSGSRMGRSQSKALLQLCGRPVLDYSLALFAADPQVGQILVAVQPQDYAEIAHICAPYAQAELVLGGATRTATVAAALSAVDSAASHIAIHDAARPLLQAADWQALQASMASHQAAVLAAAPVDSVKRIADGLVCESLDRSQLVLVQTPQLFAAELLQQAYAAAAAAGREASDDAALVEAMGASVAVVYTGAENFKLTYAADQRRAEQVLAGALPACYRSGLGWDRHQLVEGRALILGGVKIPFAKGLLGHSDADVLLHALIDALLGAAALGNIGQHFPDSDPAYKDADSRCLLRQSAALLAEVGWQIVNIDSNILAEQPKLAPFLAEMVANIAADLALPPECVSVKAKSGEGVGCVGRGEAIDAQAMVLLCQQG